MKFSTLTLCGFVLIVVSLMHLPRGAESCNSQQLKDLTSRICNRWDPLRLCKIIVQRMVNTITCICAQNEGSSTPTPIETSTSTSTAASTTTTVIP